MSTLLGQVSGSLSLYIVHMCILICWRGEANKMISVLGSTWDLISNAFSFETENTNRPFLRLPVHHSRYWIIVLSYWWHFGFCLHFLTEKSKARIKKMPAFPPLFPSSTIYSLRGIFFGCFLNDRINIGLPSTHYIIRNSLEGRWSDLRHQTSTLANENSEESLLIRVFIVNKTPKQPWNALKQNLKERKRTEREKFECNIMRRERKLCQTGSY